MDSQSHKAQNHSSKNPVFSILTFQHQQECLLIPRGKILGLCMWQYLQYKISLNFEGSILAGIKWQYWSVTVVVRTL